MVERQQYNLPEILRALRRWGGSLIDLIDLIGDPIHKGEKWVGVRGWINTSRGFSRIKSETGRRAYMLQQPGLEFFSGQDLKEYPHSPGLSIKLTSLIIDTHRRQWEHIAGPLGVDILATLYNISDFINKQPHGNPQPGGSILSAVVDGEHIHPVCFGERVKLVYRSKRMDKFIGQIYGNTKKI